METIKTMVGRNRKQVGHTNDDCREPKVKRCFNCQSTEHSKAECTACDICHQEGHMKQDCPVVKCRKCDRPGHRAKDCQATNIKCRNCNRDGHMQAVCKYCTICEEEGHKTKKCPTTTKCFGCRQFGHSKANCPSQECKRCSKLGHHELDCPERRISNEETFAPMSIPKLVIRDNAEQVDNDKEDDTYTSLRAEMNNMVSDDRRTKKSVRKTVSAQVETIDTTDEAAVPGTGGDGTGTTGVAASEWDSHGAEVHGVSNDTIW